VIVKRGTTEFFVPGEASRDHLTAVLVAAGDRRGTPLGELRSVLSGTGPPGALQTLLDELMARRIVIAAPPAHPGGFPETPLDVLAWDAGTDPAAVRAALSAATIHVLGVNTISRRVVEGLAKDGFTVCCVDHPDLRNVRLFRETGELDPASWGDCVPEDFDAWRESLGIRPVTCLVACTDFGGLSLLSEWSAAAWSNDWHFLPVALQDLVGFVGPLVVPGETSCFECFLARRDAAAGASPRARAAESFAVSGQAIHAAHPSMSSVLADVAVFELMKFYGGLWRSDIVNRTIEVSLLSAHMESHRVLKVPRCRLCSSLNEREPIAFLQETVLSKYAFGE
jgi:bacteriocin biosynthesis cyclodehydratase domain-containing protein